MFYSEAILSRRGPLGKVWLAAHMERKLSKTQTLQTNIEDSVGAIMDQEIEFMALRLSGQLLLGVVRIYSRKTKYLLDDCNDALLKIKMAFRPGVVDMTEEQLVSNKNAITLTTSGVDIDILMPDFDWDRDINFEERPLGMQDRHQANINDITLPNAEEFQIYDGPSDGIVSQDFDTDGLDLGLDFEDGPIQPDDSVSMDESFGVGRRAESERSSMGPFMDGQDAEIHDMLSQRSKSRDAMDVDMPAFDAGIDLTDLGIDFDLPPLEGERTPGQTRSPSRASSPLTELPVTPPPDAEIADITPKPKRKPKEKKQIIDTVTELQDGMKLGRNGLSVPVNKDVSGIVTEARFLPRSTVVMRLLEIRDDPLAHFLPTQTTPDGTFFCAAPPGIAPELRNMFLRPITNLHSKRRAPSPDGPPSKRARLTSIYGDDEVEVERRGQSVAPSVHSFGRGSAVPDLGLDMADFSAGLDDFQLPVPDFNPALDELDIARAKSITPASTPGPDFNETYAAEECPIAVFDIRPNTQSQDKESEPVDNEGKGYSKNTVKALGIVRRELKPTDVADNQEKVLSFRKMADKASRRAAASFFFELLVLGTRDCVKLSQNEPFDNIEVRSKDKLWERQMHSAGGHPSQPAAPSRATSAAPSMMSGIDI